MSGTEERARGGISGEKGRRREVGRMCKWEVRKVRGGVGSVMDGGRER
jgi:hypothetical protein